ncbi:YlbL family protein [Dermatobacter hominis]|uniref:YlbL family protein n=1 Tax=Dermatobacter hominis TaxID=2884263 RepID=UPI001D0FAC99|nr:S16 family serine protease [Dermatobacter hominis]UDY34868.1 PDZ domain-containing protein [Dermatobacter hominis]
MTSPSVSTAEPPSEPDVDAVELEARRRRRRRRWVWGGVGLVVLAVIAGVLFIPTPYYLFQPGSVRPAETRIDVTGAESYETDGDVLFTTVYVDQATLATLLRGVLDDAVEVKTEEEVYGPDGRDASRQVNQQRMDLSKLIATKVGLEYLGYPAEFTARGARVLGVNEEGGSVGKLRVGDVITSIDGHEVQLPGDIQVGLQGKAPGDVVTVTARRGDGDDAATVEEQITLGAAPTEDDAGTSTTQSTTTTTAPATGAPADAAAPTTTMAPRAERPVLGVSVEPADPSVESPVHVAIDSGDVTGPSAGLAWALAVVDRLTPESLTDGTDVAVTGEILSDGTVGPIGGIVQKVAAVKRAGVSTFLYPASTDEAEQRAMREVAGDDVRLVPVGTLKEAVEALHPGGVQKPG